MKIKVLFDKTTEHKNLRVGWGLSFLIDETVLFDTGENGSWLMKNMKLLNADIEKLKAVVISHDHWDHTGGLWGVLKKRKKLPVYACPDFSAEFKAKVKKLGGKLNETGDFTEISENIFVTGEIAGEYKGEYMPEQALVLKTENGISVVTGCAHPGVVKMVKKAKGFFPKENIYAVLGGFHLMNKDKAFIESIAENFRKIKVKKAGPTHCSGKSAEDIFKREYKADFISLKTGQILEV
ncbi:MBL fold metallo-hydrolase [bacterium]|jgi:7,8-dihydropterin-6-yl-methyl-4-(beta-D-ribofuranosyl)aminobenzene 5'-phosphate synthase|nr:MBL fold metallo-hydrolase [bacterium]